MNLMFVASALFTFLNRPLGTLDFDPVLLIYTKPELKAAKVAKARMPMQSGKTVLLWEGAVLSPPKPQIGNF